MYFKIFNTDKCTTHMYMGIVSYIGKSVYRCQLVKLNTPACSRASNTCGTVNEVS